MNANTSGDQFPIVTWRPPVAGDKLTDQSILDEIARRMILTITPKDSSLVWTGVEEPTDRTKIWVPLDPITGALIGQAKQWNENTSSWVAYGQQGVVEQKIPKRRFGIDQLNSGTVTKVFEFESIGTSDYTPVFTMLTFVDGGWISAPANMNNFGIAVLNMSDTMLTAQFFNVPTGGLSVRWEVTENLKQ